MVPWHMQPKYTGQPPSRAREPKYTGQPLSRARESRPRKQRKQKKKKCHEERTSEVDMDDDLLLGEFHGFCEGADPSPSSILVTTEESLQDCVVTGGDRDLADSSVPHSKPNCVQAERGTSTQTSELLQVEGVSTQTRSQYDTITTSISGKQSTEEDAIAALHDASKVDSISLPCSVEQKSNASTSEHGYQTFQRYYHVFRQGELTRLFAKVPFVRVVEEYYDHENWCVLAEKTVVE